MVNFVIVDLSLLVLFLIFISVFLYRGRKNLGKEGPLILYRTQWGVKLIEKIGGRYQKTLKFLSYISITLGYFLMMGILYLMGNSVWVYLTTNISDVVRGPPIAPLIPYFPTLFGFESFFPQLYFSSFIIAILIVATVHEFSHGIFARRYKVGIKSTGFAFFKYFPLILGAFVEQDDKQMTKKSKFEQMSILAAGVFANMIVAVLFLFLLIGFFNLSFTASGVVFSTYAYTAIDIDSVQNINGIDVASYEGILTNAGEDLNLIESSEGNYLATYEMLNNSYEGYVVAFYDAPAVRNNIEGAISKINGERISDINVLQNSLERYSPGEEVQITTIGEKGEKVYDIVLVSNPSDSEAAWLGVGFSGVEREGLIGKAYGFFNYKKDYVAYEPKFEFAPFFKDLIWWIFIINLLVALFNMLPLGILDGGRFFYLTVLGITKSKKIATRMFSGITYLILAVFVALMVKWLVVRIF